MSKQIADQQIADRYVLQSPIGRGGMGVVWRAEDSLLQRAVAIKEIELPRAVAPDERESIRKRVLREARAAARLNHANAVTVYDVIEEDGKAFIVMELIQGRTLADIVRQEGPIGSKRLADIGLAVLGALEIAHAEGIVHRDVKPANVMIQPDERVKLADFGIASVKDDPKITASGLILGSPSYMAPEQANHGTSGPEADLWGLGATLYFAAEATPPFEREGGAIPTLTAVIGDEPRPMERAGELAPVISALLEKDPVKRATLERTRGMLERVGGRDSQASTIVLPDTGELTETEEAPPPTVERTPTPAPRAVTAPAPTPTRTPTRTRETEWGKWIAAALVLALLIAAAVFVIPRLNPSEDDAGNPERRGAAGAPAEEGGTDVQVPADWATYEDPDIDYTLRYPSDWEIVPSGDTSLDFRDPETGTYLRVAWRTPPGPSLTGAWESLSARLAAEKENYQELGIEPTTYKGMDAATLEFTYHEGGADLHAVDLGFITTDGQYGMALNFQTHAENWESSQGLFEQLKEGFQPPS